MPSTSTRRKSSRSRSSTTSRSRSTARSKARSSSMRGSGSTRSSRGGTGRSSKRSAKARKSGTRAMTRGRSATRGSTRRSKTRTGSQRRSPSRGRSQARGRLQGQVTIDHDEIREWVEARGGQPSTVEGTARRGEEAGLLRIDFPGYSGADTLTAIDWDEFFEKFEDAKLAFLHDGKRGSKFNKFVQRGTRRF